MGEPGKRGTLRKRNAIEPRGFWTERNATRRRRTEVSGYSKDPRTRLGLIALLAARRVKAEKLRHDKADNSHMQADAEPAVTARAKTRKAGWVR